MIDAEDAEAEGDINPRTSVSGSAHEGSSSYHQSSDSEDIIMQQPHIRPHRQVNVPGYLSQHYVGYGLVASVIPECCNIGFCVHELG